ncbi:LOW QUALITY PROTEIN: hypothetical protein OSB04_011942 [Centaurea solstitialis]|uniref:Uncharacterized protein n=1 Tax=Centaurea solstitialis TaxID=347529 RepID=A0AA38TI02_9ASTR|nr:LOW QUALITY PROTEIN: hypothetical protein OSB04_011942 [Centaurea solstitialis]
MDLETSLDRTFTPSNLTPYNQVDLSSSTPSSSKSALVKTRSATQNEFLFAAFLSRHEPSNVTEALDISDW